MTDRAQRIREALEFIESVMQFNRIVKKSNNYHYIFIKEVLQDALDRIETAQQDSIK